MKLVMMVNKYSAVAAEIKFYLLSRRFCQLVLYFVLRFFHMLGFTLLFVCFGLVNYFSLVQVQFACVEV